MLSYKKSQIILASTSEIRKSVLASTGIEFNAVAPELDENAEKERIGNIPFKDRAHAIATAKALCVSRRFPSAFVIGSDQICEIAGAEMSKSKDQEDCIKKLRQLNGKTHYQNNSVVVAHRNKIIFKKFSRASLRMRKLGVEQIKTYVVTDNPIGTAGAYKYEGLGKHLFESVTGSYYAILGLDLQPLISFLHKENIICIK